MEKKTSLALQVYSVSVSKCVLATYTSKPSMKRIFRTWDDCLDVNFAIKRWNAITMSEYLLLNEYDDPGFFEQKNGNT